jgi:hypothetical protein
VAVSAFAVLVAAYSRSTHKAASPGPPTTVATAPGPSGEAAGDLPVAPLSDSEYAARVNAVCAATGRALEGLPAPADDDLGGRAVVLRRGADLLARELAQIRALTPPEADRARVEDLYRKVDVVVDLGRRAAAAAGDGDAAGVEATMAEADDASVEAGDGLHAAGLEECSAAFLP